MEKSLAFGALSFRDVRVWRAIGFEALSASTQLPILSTDEGPFRALESLWEGCGSSTSDAGVQLGQFGEDARGDFLEIGQVGG